MIWVKAALWQAPDLPGLTVGETTMTLYLALVLVGFAAFIGALFVVSTLNALTK